MKVIGTLQAGAWVVWLLIQSHGVAPVRATGVLLGPLRVFN
jgi:hypothetical protein